MRLPIAALGLILTACYSDSDGISPPLDRIYFPVGLTTNCDARAGAPPDCVAKYLYVANSDFDLQYNAGSVQSLDLDRVRTILGKVYADGEANCKAAKLEQQSDAQKVLAPGPCSAVALENPQDGSEPVVELSRSVGIGAFASDVILTTNLDGSKKRLLLPVRGEASLHWIDIDESSGELKCDESGEPPTCGQKHRIGTVPTANTRNVKMPPEPYGIAVSEENDAIVVTHQTRGELSLFFQDLSKDGWNAGPRFESVSPLNASQAVAVAAAPEPKYVRDKRRDWIDKGRIGPDPFPPEFLVGYANLAQIDLVRFWADNPSSPSRPYASVVASAPVLANAGARVSRGIAFDDTKRRACDERECLVDAASDSCRACANESVGVYASNRSPSSLLVGVTIPGTLDSGARNIPQFVGAEFLPIGASRVYRGKILVDGKLETRIFVVCFEQRRIAIYNPTTNRPEGEITTGRGPHAMAFDFSEDPPRALAYVGHFTDSYVGVVQLDQSKLRTYGKIVLSLAQRAAPRASK